MSDQDSNIIYIPPFSTPVKAKKDTPCNGCGWCCHTEICAIGEHFFPSAQAPCPAIIYSDGRVHCGIVLAEAEVLATRTIPGDSFADMLGIGKGCCADDPEEAA